MSGTPAADFAVLLRRRRFEAGLSQEQLAERAGISTEAISGYERGLRSVPRRDTIALLVTALDLGGDEKAEFERAARRKSDHSATESVPEHNLPWQGTSFVGRVREVDEISALLAARRLVTITGTGGIGKTRIALEVASRLLQRQPGEIRFVDLAPLNDGAPLLGRIAAVLDVQLPGNGDLLSAFAAAIKSRRAVLLLDNCEHIIDAIREIVVAIMQACPEVTLIATSRERLSIPGEVAYPLGTLAIPAHSVTTAAECRSYDALNLFAERAATAKRGFLFSDEHVEAAIEICRRLDGIALAIELAASRLPILGLADLRSQLARHFRAIGGGRHDHPARHETLNATIAWSHALLADRERTLFRRLAVFAGGWTLDAAEAVCADDALPKAVILDALLSLVEKSLAAVDLDGNTARYSFFDSTRAFARDRLEESGESAVVLRSHAQWVASFADRAEESFTVTSRNRWEADVLPEIDNVFAAIAWAVAPGGNDTIAGRIVGGLRVCWQYPGLSIRGQEHVEVMLSRLSEQEHPYLVARLLLAQSYVRQGTAMVQVVKRAIALLEPSGDRRLLIMSYTSLSYALAHMGNYADALAANDVAHELVLEMGLARTGLHQRQLFARSTIFQLQGALREAKDLATESLSLATVIGDAYVISTGQSVLAELEFAEGNPQQAVTLAQAALTSARGTRGANEVYLYCNLAAYQLVLGETDAAAESARTVLTHPHISTGLVIHAAVQHIATVAALRGSPVPAARLLGHVNEYYRGIGVERDPTDQSGCDMLVESLRKQLSEGDIASLALEGAQLTEEAALDLALGL